MGMAAANKKRLHHFHPPLNAPLPVTRSCFNQATNKWRLLAAWEENPKCRKQNEDTAAFIAYGRMRDNASRTWAVR